MVQWALAFTLGLLVGFFYPRTPLLNSHQNIRLQCPDIPECPAVPICTPDAPFVQALEIYQGSLAKCLDDRERSMEWLDSCKGDVQNLQRDLNDLRSR